MRFSRRRRIGICRAQAASRYERSPQQKLDLAVQAAQIVVGPSLDGVQQGWVDPQ